jgi:hypothetical protein
MTWICAPINLSNNIVVPWNIFFQWKWFQCKIQLQTVDHSVRWSMKNAASCVKRCEMQDTPSTWFSNAYCSLGSFPGLRLSEGLYEIKLIVKVCVEYTDILMLYSRQTYSSPDQTHDRHLQCWCMLSFNSLATTAEHHKFCRPLSYSSDVYKTCHQLVSCVVSTGDSKNNS